MSANIGTLGRIRTSKHIRTSRSIPINTGRARMRWSRVKETEELALKRRRLRAR
jgi:hypothetical protein